MNDDQPSQPLTEGSWAMMSDKFIEPIPPHPLTDAELAQIKERTAHAVTIDEMQESDADNIFDLINTVHRLRAALTALGRNERAAGNRALELQEKLAETASARDYLSGRIDYYMGLCERITQRWENADAEITAQGVKIKRLESERAALVRKLGLDWGPDEFGDLSDVPDVAKLQDELEEYRQNV